jgi:hypothetical protein
MTEHRTRLLVGAGLAAYVLVGVGADWREYGYDTTHFSRQPNESTLNASSIASLHVDWDFTIPGGGQFTASPSVFDNTVYIGGLNGIFYAIYASGPNRGTIRWQYPPAVAPSPPDACGTTTTPFATYPYDSMIIQSFFVPKVRFLDENKVKQETIDSWAKLELTSGFPGWELHTGGYLASSEVLSLKYQFDHPTYFRRWGSFIMGPGRRDTAGETDTPYTGDVWINSTTLERPLLVRIFTPNLALATFHYCYSGTAYP